MKLKNHSGSENEIPVGLGYIKNIDNEDKGKKSQLLKSKKGHKNESSNEYKRDSSPECSKTSKENAYKRKEKHKKMNAVYFSDSEDEASCKSETSLNRSINKELEREATPPPDNLINKKRKTKISKESQKMETEMRDVLTETATATTKLAWEAREPKEWFLCLYYKGFISHFINHIGAILKSKLRIRIPNQLKNPNF